MTKASFLPLNMDYSKSVIISAKDQRWVDAPVSGISRIQFERENFESGWTTSLVRYAPNTQFPSHFHPGGEQFYVIEGTFVDETGKYCAGTYVQNPVDSFHSPSSEEGTLIFVRLGATDQQAKEQLVVHNLSSSDAAKITTGTNDYLSITTESAETHLTLSNTEILLLEGELQDKHLNKYLPYSWFRIAAEDSMEFLTLTKVKYLQRPLLR